MRYIVFLFILHCSCLIAQNSITYLFVGTYTDSKPDTGIYVFRLNNKTGELRRVDHAVNIINPSYLSISPNGRYLYACTDTKMPNAGSITSFTIDSATGGLRLINKQPGAGENPVYVAIHSNNQSIVMANYTAGSVSAYSANDDGSLNPVLQNMQFSGSSINKERQEKPHIHCAVFSPDFDYIYLTDLGSDKIRAFKYNSEIAQPLTAIDSLTINSVPGSGPRHFTFHPNGKFAYCIEELSCMVSAYSYSNGKLIPIQRILSASSNDSVSSGADIHVSPDGQYLYASNRGENTISIFTIAKDGKLNLVGRASTFGETPRNFALDPSGKFLLVANQKTNNIVVFKRNSKTGLLKKTGFEVNVPRPTCLKLRNYEF